MLNERSALASRVLDDGRVLDLFPLLLGRVRLTISDDVSSMTWIEGF